MFEIDFRPVDCETTAGSVKSGDAIAIRFTSATDGLQKVIVIDGGFQTNGPQMVAHIRGFFGTDHVDLMICTHPDADHINGLQHVIEDLFVDELLIHQPRQHTGRRVERFGNIEAIDNLLAAARANGTTISDPFTGTERFEGQLVVLGPDKDLYEQLVEEHLDKVIQKSKSASLSNWRTSQWATRAVDLFDSVVALLPFEETLTDQGETNPRNETSVVTLLRIDGQRLMFTGDAGTQALTAAADDYEARVGSFAEHPLDFFQTPHHGSRRNIGPTLLDRILGSRDAPHTTTVSYISAAAAAPKHPSPKVVNALKRRGAVVLATLGVAISYTHDAPSRLGWGPATPLPALDESADADD